MRATAEQRDTVQGWFAGRLPDGWFTGAPEVTIDREEVLVVGTLPEVALDDEATPAAAATAAASRIQRFREETRGQRMRIASEAEHRFGRKVAWGARCGDRVAHFTSLSVPVMTRLRQRERMVLDTLVEAGVARSRSEALAWCVKLVGDNESEWISGLRDALTHVERVRDQGPPGEAEISFRRGRAQIRSVAPAPRRWPRCASPRSGASSPTSVRTSPRWSSPPWWPPADWAWVSLSHSSSRR